MDKTAIMIKNRLSLRPPQEQSLNILAELTSKLSLVNDSNIEEELHLVNELYPTCTDFERDFPSMCFALATGVGKTRLMGAFISYLYLNKGIKNFFVLAPNLTIYNKLKADFSEPNNPKYVFKGIGDFSTNPPTIITGDNYNQVSENRLFYSQVHINIFNISKINAETRGDSVPRIKRLSEYLGISYFNYLARLKDLVLLMDESHHYRADRGMQVINELKPILGLELTATPQIEKGATPQKFKNVVFEYSLAKAIKDGFVKEPSVATRKNFNPGQYSDDELDRIKIEDGIRIHEDTKVSLDIYSRENKALPIKPFVLIVAKDTDHSGKIKTLVQSHDFFDGYYADKVIEINSNQRGEEKEENILLLLDLERHENPVEIVIHVNMLKEGWDVTNLYTIVPLRTATSLTLREQTIGRGLRLPYGTRTGNSKVDKLTIVAHDRFQEIVDAANHPDSIIKRENIIEIDPDEIGRKKEVVTVPTTFVDNAIDENEVISIKSNDGNTDRNFNQTEIEIALFNTFNDLNKEIKTAADLSNNEIKEKALSNLKEKLYSNPQLNLFTESLVQQAKTIYEKAVKDFSKYFIEIPRIIIQQSEIENFGFTDFDLDVSNLNYQPVSEEIIIRQLRDGKIEIIDPKGSKYRYDSVENIIINELMNMPEIDYDRQSELLYKLSNQAVNKFRSYLNEEQVFNVVQFTKWDIARFIYAQMMDGHFYIEKPKYEKPLVYPYERILDHNYSKFTTDQVHLYTETITPTNQIPSLLFSGFSKASHRMYKFDSKTEKDFAIILEQDNEVKKWLRPAPNQFRIYWRNNSRMYYPDFVVETNDTIYLVETKKESEVSSTDVQDKAIAALEYCKNATEYTSQNRGKPWKYILIPHQAVQVNMGFKFLMENFEYI
jgi:type III restriction enzyme